MTLVADLLVASGATTGSILRYSTGRFVSKIVDTDFPWGTWIINMVGAFLLGLFFREIWITEHSLNWWLFLGTGFCGGFTTFSAMSIDTVRLLRFNRVLAIIYLGSSISIGCLLAWLPTLFSYL